MELLFALELLFIIRPGAAVYNSPTRGSGVLENALLLVCAAGDLLVISASVSWDHDSGHVLAILC